MTGRPHLALRVAAGALTRLTAPLLPALPHSTATHLVSAALATWFLGWLWS